MLSIVTFALGCTANTLCSKNIIIKQTEEGRDKEMIMSLHCSAPKVLTYLVMALYDHVFILMSSGWTTFQCTKCDCHQKPLETVHMY